MTITIAYVDLFICSATKPLKLTTLSLINNNKSTLMDSLSDNRVPIHLLPIYLMVTTVHLVQVAFMMDVSSSDYRLLTDYELTDYRLLTDSGLMTDYGLMTETVRVWAHDRLYYISKSN